MKNSSFKSYSNYYDFFYEDKNYKKEVNFLKNFFYKNDFKVRNILEFGSGTGNHAILLAKLGYNIHGIELSSEMVLKAKKHKNFFLQKGDITKINLKKKYDVVLSMFHVISYLTNNEKVTSAFKNANKHIKKNGLFIFDFWYTPAVLSQKPTRKIKKIKKNNLELTRIAQPTNHINSNIVDVNYKIIVKDLKLKSLEIFNELHSMRHFSLPEIDLLASIHGFERIKALDILTKKKPGKDTWGLCVFLKKK